MSMIAVKRTIAALILGACATTANAGLLDGHTLQYQYLLFSSSTPYDDGAAGSYTVGAGVEISKFLYDIDLQSDGFTVIFKLADHLTDVAFNGFRLTDINGTIAPFTSFSMGTNTALLTETFGPIELTFDADNVFVNWQGTGVQPGIAEFHIGAAAAAIPEPEAYALLIAGLGLLGFQLRRTRR
jgi:hypothetical protein